KVCCLTSARSVTRSVVLGQQRFFHNSIRALAHCLVRSERLTASLVSATRTPSTGRKLLTERTTHRRYSQCRVRACSKTKMARSRRYRTRQNVLRIQTQLRVNVSRRSRRNRVRRPQAKQAERVRP